MRLFPSPRPNFHQYLFPQTAIHKFNDLQDTINYFLAPIPTSGKSSFTHTSLAAKKGLGSSAALDPMWAGGSCLGHEGPIACEYRLIKPSVAIITIGLMDVRYQTQTKLFRTNIEQIVQLSMKQGIIPVLTNIVVLPNQDALSFDVSMQVDNILLDIADQYQIPHINLWRAVQSLPDLGIGPDHTHMRHVVGSYCDFTGAEQAVGGTLRNLLTLEALDTLRRNVLASTN
jgi:hypothetical protein